MIMSFIFGAIGIIMVVGVIIIYNHLVALKHNVAKCWANIDVLLKQRHDELPKLVETCKEYMRHEEETLTRVIEARSQVAKARESNDIKAIGAAESMLRGGLDKLFACVEQYPDLKANETFQHLQHRITEMEESIADRRELYNESVNIHNVRIEQFPDVLVARMFAYLPKTLLEFQDHEKADINVGSLFAKKHETTE